MPNNGYQNLHYLFNYLFYHQEPAGSSPLFTEPEPKPKVWENKLSLVTSVRLPKDEFHVCKTRSYPFRPDRNASSGPQLQDALEKMGYSSFQLTVGYPGLYIGLGYAHGLNDIDKEKNNDFKVGFCFDYTTGLPYLPGSSVKGTLRSCFDEKPDDTLAALKEVGVEADSKALSALSRKIFGNPIKDPEIAAASSENGQEGSVVFFDAFPCSVGDPILKPNEVPPLMHDDYITPQRENRLGDPTPIHTLKVSPGVQFRFIFSIPETIEVPCAAGTLTLERSDIQKWFQQLLEDWGIGAKTNSGYGLVFSKSP